jgi:hypothetical protein
MSNDPPEVEPGDQPDGGWRDDPNLAATRKLLASVEELRALLAPLTPDQREEVLELARRLRHPWRDA